MAGVAHDWCSQVFLAVIVIPVVLIAVVPLLLPILIPLGLLIIPLLLLPLLLLFPVPVLTPGGAAAGGGTVITITPGRRRREEVRDGPALRAATGRVGLLYLLGSCWTGFLRHS